MTTLTIRNFDDALKERLRICAAEHGHSMEAEARRILNWRSRKTVARQREISMTAFMTGSLRLVASTLNFRRASLSTIRRDSIKCSFSIRISCRP